MREKSRRCIRIAEDIHKVLSLVLVKDLSDPRVSSLSVTHVDVAPDLSVAKIFFISSVVDVSEEQKQIYLEGLRSAKPYLRRHLSAHLFLRVTPNLVFYYDDHLSHAFKLDRLIDNCVA